ncbi:transposase [Streptomyces sp. NPDC056983]|uniref:transposase n=1 Tax=Streptomyces sp. NPDC056983 TaxID=3345987 RepID=UPI0036301D4C
MAALICTKFGHRPRLICRIHLDRGPAKGRRKGFTETDYARLLDAAHQQLGGPIVVVWDNLNTHGRTMRQLVDARSSTNFRHTLPSSSRSRASGHT